MDAQKNVMVNSRSILLPRNTNPGIMVKPGGILGNKVDSRYIFLPGKENGVVDVPSGTVGNKVILDPKSILLASAGTASKSGGAKGKKLIKIVSLPGNAKAGKNILNSNVLLSKDINNAGAVEKPVGISGNKVLESMGLSLAQNSNKDTGMVEKADGISGNKILVDSNCIFSTGNAKTDTGIVDKLGGISGNKVLDSCSSFLTETGMLEKRSAISKLLSSDGRKSSSKGVSSPCKEISEDVHSNFSKVNDHEDYEIFKSEIQNKHEEVSLHFDEDYDSSTPEIKNKRKQVNLLLKDLSGDEEYEISKPEIKKQKQGESRVEKLWPVSNEKLLISLFPEFYKLYQERFYKSKEAMYGAIAEKMNEVQNLVSYTRENILNKWQGYEKNFKKVGKHNNKTGRNKKTMPHYEELYDIFIKMPNFFPEMLLSSTHEKRLDNEKRDIDEMEANESKDHEESSIEAEMKNDGALEKKSRPYNNRTNQAIHELKLQMQEASDQKLELWKRSVEAAEKRNELFEEFLRSMRN